MYSIPAFTKNFLILKGKSKGMFRVYYAYNKYYFVSIKHSFCMCEEFEKNKKCEHYDNVVKLFG